MAAVAAQKRWKDLYGRPSVAAPARHPQELFSEEPPVGVWHVGSNAVHTHSLFLDPYLATKSMRPFQGPFWRAPNITTKPIKNSRPNRSLKGMSLFEALHRSAHDSCRYLPQCLQHALKTLPVQARQTHSTILGAWAAGALWVIGVAAGRWSNRSEASASIVPLSPGASRRA